MAFFLEVEKDHSKSHMKFQTTLNSQINLEKYTQGN
jgi:hypothetical protein